MPEYSSMIVLSRPSLECLVAAAPSREPDQRSAVYFELGRDALLYGLRQNGLRAGDRVLFPAFFCESALGPIRAAGLIPVFAEVDKALALPPSELVRCLEATNFIAAVFPHYFGQSAPDRDVLSFCRDRGITMILDGAHELLTNDRAQHVEPPFSGAVFSLRKQLGLRKGAVYVPAEGGREEFDLQPAPVFSNGLSHTIIRRVERLAAATTLINPYGRTIGTARRFLSHLSSEGDAGRQFVQPSRIPGPLMSLISDTRYLHRVSEARKANYRFILDRLENDSIRPLFGAGVPARTPQVLPLMTSHPGLVGYLRDAGIGASVWPGPELPPQVRERRDEFPLTHHINDHLVCVPVHQSLSDRHLSYICERLRQWRTASQ